MKFTNYDKNDPRIPQFVNVKATKIRSAGVTTINGIKVLCVGVARTDYPNVSWFISVPCAELENGRTKGFYPEKFSGAWTREYSVSNLLKCIYNTPFDIVKRYIVNG